MYSDLYSVFWNDYCYISMRNTEFRPTLSNPALFQIPSSFVILFGGVTIAGVAPRSTVGISLTCQQILEAYRTKVFFACIKFVEANQENIGN